MSDTEDPLRITWPGRIGIPERSKQAYEQYYQQFMDWREAKGVDSFSENVMLDYFTELSQKWASTTLRKIHAMLRSTLYIKHNIDLSNYLNLKAFLKENSDGFQARKSKVFTGEEIKRFIIEAPDNVYLATKVALIVGIMGACRKHELYRLKIDDILDLGNAVLISIRETRTNLERRFTISGHYYSIFKKYWALRPNDFASDHFFIKYQKGRCVRQVIGVNRLGIMPKEIAKFLNLRNPEDYTGHCFKRSSVRMAEDAVIMPSLDHCMTNSSDMTTLTNTLEIFDTYKHREDKDSDEESFHLPLDDDETETISESLKNEESKETEDEILNKFDSSALSDNIDSKLEEQLLNGDEENSENTKINGDLENNQNEEVKNLEPELTNGKSEEEEKKDEEVPKTKDVETEESTNKTDDKTSSNSPKQNEDSEDLLDISIIRDVDEDNAASAYNNEETEEMEADSPQEKDEEVEEEIDMDTKEDQFKSDDVDIEETRLEGDATKDSTSDGEADNGSNNVQEANGDSTVETDCRLDETTGDLIKNDNISISPQSEENQSESNKENENTDDLSTKPSLKRPSEDVDSRSSKKPRNDLLADIEIREVEKPKEKLPLTNLSSLSDFMKSKKHKRLTMHDLEEFCLQKICEVIVHKSELGDVHHQLKLQEQLIDTMRKEIQQLSKQARDLEIVNRKLMNDLKQQTATQKPLSPLKITRSVGLQVKFTPTFEANLKRKSVNGSQRVPLQTTPRNRVVPNASTNNSSNNNKQVTPAKPQVPKPNTPLLSQALQNRRNANDSIAKPTSPRAKTSDPKNGSVPSVIDLTDEDDKKDKNKNAANKTVSKNITVPLRTTPLRVNAPQGIRLATTQSKVSPISSVVNSSTPQVMYVVQSSPQNVLASTLGPKAVVVNFQPTNGVLTSALNGSAVSVIPKQGSTLQFKPVAPKSAPVKIKPANKHPAPLPSPPVVRVSSDKPLKPIPPKPHLTIRKTDTGIILQWKMPYELEMYEVIASYQLYAYQETSASPSTDMWRKVGDVKALALPMACTLTQFADKNKYYFAVRPVDIHKRIGMFSEPEEISL